MPQHWATFIIGRVSSGPALTAILQRPSRIALGAAYASLASQSVASFAEKCAFGLQKGKVVNQGENDEQLDLEGSARTIWYQEVGRARSHNDLVLPFTDMDPIAGRYTCDS